MRDNNVRFLFVKKPRKFVETKILLYDFENLQGAKNKTHTLDASHFHLTPAQTSIQSTIQHTPFQSEGVDCGGEISTTHSH